MAALLWGMTSLQVGGNAADHVVWQGILQRGLRASFMLIAVGAVLGMRAAEFIEWRWTVDVALMVLALAVAGEAVTALARFGWFADIDLQLGAHDGLERRLFRLGSMAAFAVPMLALLAASERKENPVDPPRGSLPAMLLVRFEPWLFAIGAAALPGFLMAAAVLDREIAWLSPVGADTTLAACAAATIRAYRRLDRLAFGGWLLVSASMMLGLLMGAYAFDGPLRPPGFVGEYGTVTRTLLRDLHVFAMCAGVVGVVLADGSGRRVRP